MLVSLIGTPRLYVELVQPFEGSLSRWVNSFWTSRKCFLMAMWVSIVERAFSTPSSGTGGPTLSWMSSGPRTVRPVQPDMRWRM